MVKGHFISAVGTPLSQDELLDDKGLERHLADQWENGIGGVLVAGTMGLMQLLRDETYRALARRASELCAGKIELMIGAGDCSLARTKDRISFLNELKLDGVVVLTPFFVRFAQDELVEYYRALADFSRAPLYMYDLPQRAGKIELATALELSKHPNIAGIKCSDEPGYARQIMDAVSDRFRVIIAQPVLIDTFLKFGVREHLDGMFAIAPQWTSAIGRHCERGEWAEAAKYQKLLTELRGLFGRYDVFQAMTVMLNARGIGGNYAPRPLRKMSPPQREQLLAEPIVVKLLAEKSGKAK